MKELEFNCYAWSVLICECDVRTLNVGTSTRNTILLTNVAYTVDYKKTEPRNARKLRGRLQNVIKK